MIARSNEQMSKRAVLKCLPFLSPSFVNREGGWADGGGRGRGRGGWRGGPQDGPFDRAGPGKLIYIFL